MDFKDIKLIVSEIDGIITEGLSGIGEFNTTMFKEFYIKDFEAINLIKKYWTFVALSSDAAVNASLCRKRNIPFFFAERSKFDLYKQILMRYNVNADNVLYIGNSYSDIDCLRASAFSVCPEDAVIQVKNTVDHVAPIYGGNGVICYVYEMLEKFRLQIREE